MEALDTLAHRALVELDVVRRQLDSTEATLRMLYEQNQGVQPGGAPYDEVHDTPAVPEDPAPEPARKRRLCYANSREYVHRFTGEAGPSRPTQDPAPVDDEEEEDPEEVIPVLDDEEQKVF